MDQSLLKIIQGYRSFREKYASGDNSVMRYLSNYGQKPFAMVIACCDSRVDPALLLQCDPGDLFVVRNVANIVPPYEKDGAHHGTSAALEFGICYLKIKHLILLGHSQCGGIQALLNPENLHQDDFISNWVNVVQNRNSPKDEDLLAKKALEQSFQNCLTFPWLKDKIEDKTLQLHQWFFDLHASKIFVYSQENEQYRPLKED